MSPVLRRQVARHARRQHGVVTREQLLALGLTDHMIDWALTTHQLIALFPGVYRVAGAPDTWRSRAVAAHRRVARQLDRLGTAATPSAVVAVGGRAAAHLHGLAGHARAPELTLVASRRSRATSVPVAVRPSLQRADVVDVDRVPTTSLAWTAVELAASTRDSDRTDLLAHLLATHQVRPGQLTGAAHRADGLRGRDGVLRAVARLGPRPDHVRSRAERTVVDACVAIGLPRPRTNHRVTTAGDVTYELDLAWPDVRLDIEVDGPHHLLPDQRRRDRARDRELRADGWEVGRFPVDEVDEDPAGVADRVQALFEGLSMSLHPDSTGVE